MAIARFLVDRSRISLDEEDVGEFIPKLIQSGIAVRPSEKWNIQVTNEVYDYPTVIAKAKTLAVSRENGDCMLFYEAICDAVSILLKEFYAKNFALLIATKSAVTWLRVPIMAGLPKPNTGFTLRMWKYARKDSEHFYRICLRTVEEREELVADVLKLESLLEKCDIAAVGERLKTAKSIYFREGGGVYSVGQESYDFSRVAY